MTLQWKARVLSNLIPKDHGYRSLLDIGCAEGILTDELSRLLNITLAVGIDISRLFIQWGKERHKTIQLIHGDGSLPFKDKSFDLTICSDFIEHLSEVSKFLQNIKRVSKFVLFKIPIESCLVGNLLRRVGVYENVGKDHPSGHIHLFSKKSAMNIVEQNGFSIIRYSFEITPQNILYYGVPKAKFYLNPFIYLERMSRRFFRRWYIPLWGGHLFVLCKG